MNFVMSGVSAHTTMSNMWTSSGVKKMPLQNLLVSTPL